MSGSTFPMVTLRRGDLSLREFTAADVPAVARACADDVIQRWLPLPSPYTLDDAEAFCLRFTKDQLTSGRGIVFGVERAGELVAAIDLKHTDWRARTTEVGYWTAPWARGQGVMTRAAALLSDWVLTEVGFARVELLAAIGNVGSQRVAQKAGFVREGLLRNAGYTHGGQVDLAVFSRIDTDVLA